MRRLAAFALSAALTLTLAAPAQSTGTVTTAAHLEVHPRAPYVRTAWTMNPGTTGQVLVSTWIARVDCNTGRNLATLGLSQIGGMDVGTGTWYSRDVQVLPPECLIPAGNVVDTAGHVLASSVGPLYRW
jgi:hypothetical protein